MTAASVVSGSPLANPAVVTVSRLGSVTEAREVRLGASDGYDISTLDAGDDALRVGGTFLNGTLFVGAASILGGNDGSTDGFIARFPNLGGFTHTLYGGAGDQQVAAVETSGEVVAVFGMFTTDLSIASGPVMAATDNFELFLHISEPGRNVVFNYPSAALPPISREGGCPNPMLAGPECLRVAMTISSDESLIILGFGLDGTLTLDGVDITAADSSPVVVALRTSDGSLAWHRVLSGAQREESVYPMALAGQRIVVGMGTNAVLLNEQTGATEETIDLAAEYIAAQGEFIAVAGPLSGPLIVGGDPISPVGAFDELVTVHRVDGSFVGGLQLVGDTTRSNSEIGLDGLGGLILNPGGFVGVLSVGGSSFDRADGLVLARYELP